MAHAGAGPNPIDIHVGRRVRLRRKERGFSQERLAIALGVTFQQVQKYERGTNRISASKLFEIAQILESPVSDFFQGLADPAKSRSGDSARARQSVVEELLSEPDGAILAEAFLSIRRGDLRKSVAELVAAIAAHENAVHDAAVKTPWGSSRRSWGADSRAAEVGGRLRARLRDR